MVNEVNSELSKLTLKNLGIDEVQDGQFRLITISYWRL